jgi:hypothetical protein
MKNLKMGFIIIIIISLKASAQKSSSFGWAPSDDPFRNSSPFVDKSRNAVCPCKRLPTVSRIYGLPSVQDQGSQFTCCAFAMAYTIKSYQMMQKKKEVWQGNYNQPNSMARVCSPSFIYYKMVFGEKDPCQTTLDTKDLFDSLHARGTCTWDLYPMDTSMPLGCVMKVPDSIAINSARSNTICGRVYLDATVQNCPDIYCHLKQYIYENVPVLIGTVVDTNFRKENMHKPNFVYVPGDKLLAMGHCMVLVGYNDAKRMFTIMNSFGPHWGNQGFFNIHYSDFGKILKEATVYSDCENFKAPIVHDFKNDVTLLRFSKENESIDTTIKLYKSWQFVDSSAPDSLNNVTGTLTFLNKANNVNMAYVKFRKGLMGDEICSFQCNIGVPISFRYGGKILTTQLDRIAGHKAYFIFRERDDL